MACESGEMGGEGLIVELAVVGVGICGSDVVVDAWRKWDWSLRVTGDGDERDLD